MYIQRKPSVKGFKNRSTLPMCRRLPRKVGCLVSLWARISCSHYQLFSAKSQLTGPRPPVGRLVVERVTCPRVPTVKPLTGWYSSLRRRVSSCRHTWLSPFGPRLHGSSIPPPVSVGCTLSGGEFESTSFTRIVKYILDFAAILHRAVVGAKTRQSQLQVPT
jgi:hypothetical protein